MFSTDIVQVSNNLAIFFSNIFDLQLVESEDTELSDTEGHYGNEWVNSWKVACPKEQIRWRHFLFHSRPTSQSSSSHLLSASPTGKKGQRINADQTGFYNFYRTGRKSLSPGSLVNVLATIQEKILIKKTRALVSRCVRGGAVAERTSLAWSGWKPKAGSLEASTGNRPWLFTNLSLGEPQPFPMDLPKDASFSRSAIQRGVPQSAWQTQMNYALQES